MKRFIVSLLFCYAGIAAQGQVYSIKNYTTANGLINNRTGAVSQDAKGYIWIATDFGICRYDGKSMKYFPLGITKTYYNASCVKRYKQYVLFTTPFGVALCCGDSLIEVNAIPKQKLGTYESVALNDSVFLITVPQGLMKIFKNKPAEKIAFPFTIPASTYGLVVYKDAAENIWLGFNDRLLVFPKGDLKNPVRLSQFDGHYINIIKHDPQENMYIGTDRGLFRIKKESLHDPLQPATLLYPVKENIISGLAFDKEGHAWMSNRYGVRKFSDDFKSSVLITPENGIASFYTWDAFCDRENNLWFATENGVNKLINTPVINYRFPENEFPSIKSGLVWNDSTFYFTNGVSVSKIVNDKLIKVSGFHDETGYLEERLWKTPEGQLLITSNKLQNLLVTGNETKQFTDNNAHLSPQKTIAANNNAGFINMTTAFNDKEGNMWFGSEQGLQLYRKGRIVNYPIKDKAGNTQVINGITKDKFGDLWLAARNNIFRCHAHMQNDSMIVQPFEVIDTLNGLNKQRYDKIFCDNKNRIWAGGTDGVLTGIHRDAGNNITLIKNYAPPEISAMRITAFIENDNGDIWTGTAMGIDILTTDAQGKVTIRKDAYSSELCGKYIFFLRKQQHRIYVGTTGCMAVIDLSEEKHAAPAPFVFITETRISNNRNDSFLNAAHYQLPPDSNTISFYFNATSFLNDPVKYRYMLEGVDADWNAPSTADNITYTQLKPGTYTFKVSAQNGDGVWSEAAAVKTFTLQRHFYNTVWFYVLCAFVFIGIVYFIYRYRVKQIKNLHSIRTNISNDLHDDIGSTLSSITMMSNLVKQKIATDPVQSAALASQIEESGRQMIYAMSDIVWSIKPGNDTLEQLINRLREYMNIMLESTLDDYALITEEDISVKHINMYLRRDLYLICKEIIHNTAKYAAAKTLRMQINTEGGMLRISSEEDGKGFDLNTVKKGNGLQNIFMRVAANKGTVQCITSPGNGTKWLISIPL